MAKSGLSFRKKKRLSTEIKQTIRDYLLGCLISCVLGVSLVISLGYTITNVGISMENAIVHNQKILVNRAAYFLFDPQIGDVVVFKQGSSGHMYIKRVVAGPQDTVQIIDGGLYVNDILVKDGFDKIADPGIAVTKIQLEDDEFFVMGDNRNNSEDSRSDTIGAVQKSEMIGKAWFALPAKGGSMKPIR